METVSLLILIVAVAFIISKTTGNTSSPITVADAKSDRFKIKKEIVFLEMLIDELGTKKSDEKELELKLAQDELKKKEWELHEAEKKVFREEMFETM